MEAFRRWYCGCRRVPGYRKGANGWYGGGLEDSLAALLRSWRRGGITVVVTVMVTDGDEKRELLRSLCPTRA